MNHLVILGDSSAVQPFFSMSLSFVCSYLSESEASALFR